MEGTNWGNDPLSVQDYINTYFLPRTQKSGTQIPIGQITRFPLKFIVSTIARVAGSSTLHLATWTHMCIGVECLRGLVYDWCSGLVPIMKIQLFDCKRGRKKNFIYTIILVSFFFKRVFALSPAVILPSCPPREPRLMRWGKIFLQQGGGGGVKSGYDYDFYSWWSGKVHALE